MKKNKKLLDFIGAGCGVFLVLALLVSIISGAVANSRNVTLTGSAPGKEGDVTVEIVTNGSTISAVNVTEHNETEGIGTKAVDALPGAIVEANSLAVDGISEATITSNAIKTAAANALTSGGFDPAAFGYTAPAPVEEPVPIAAPAPVEAPAADAGFIPGTYTGEGQGLFSTVVVNLTVDENGITDVTLDTSGETETIGAAHDEEFIEQILAKGANIDGVSGASVTSQAIRDAVASALSQAAGESAEEAPAEDTAAESAARFADGEYTAAAESLLNFENVYVTIVVEGGKIVNVDVDTSSQSTDIGAAAEPVYESQILDAQGEAIDGVSGATVTSMAVQEAYEDVLKQAALPAGDTAADEAAAVAVPEGAVTATGSANGIDGPVVVQVTADAEHIYDVQVLEQNETQGIGSVAVEKLPGAIVEANSILVDGITGATVTSTAIRDGVREALTKAGLDPTVFEVEPDVSAEPAEKTEVTLEYDVVVVGAGGAGLTSAVRATEEGASVLVVEKMPIVGGNSLRAEGGMNAADTSVQAALGIEGSTVENFVADTLRLGHDLADPELVQTLAENSAEAIDWLDSIGAPLTKVAATGGTEHAYLHKPEDGRPVGSYLVEKLRAYADKLGIEIMLNTKATEILMNGERACGIRAEDAEHIYIIKAKAVVLATGGFGSNFELMASYDPSLADAVTTNHSGAQGDGIMMAQAVGADTVDMEQIQLHPTVIQQNGLLVSESVRSHGAILVNAEGKRFVNDMAGRDVVSQAELKQPGAYAFIVFDQGLVDEVALTHKFIDGGYALQGATYEELAQAMGLEGDAVRNFVETMENWNAFVEAGEDKDFGRSAVSMIDISTAPYYAIKIAPGIHHTMGGIKIDTHAQVINTEGEVIAGLFACGETTGGIHGGNRVGGNAVCDFIVFGRIAGASAAEYAAAIAPAEFSSQAGSFTGTAAGRNGDVTVEVTADAEHIYAIEVTSHAETEGIGSVAVEKLPAAIVAAQSLDVDNVSGATITSGAIKEAVGAALASAGIDPAGLLPLEADGEGAAEEAAEPAGDRVYEADVVVIGAGGAGMSAAITASDAGMTVIVVESQPMVGGNSVRSTGGMNAAPTEWREMNTFGENAGVESTLAKVANFPDNARIQELGAIVAQQWAEYQANPEGYFDSVELFQLDTLIGGGGLNDPDLVRTLAERSSDAIDWLGGLDPEVILHNVAQFGGASVKRIHRPVDENGKTLSVGAYVVPLLQQNLEKRGVTVLLSTTANEIIRDSLGIVRGIVCTDENGNTVSVNARSVVIATGGFGANNDMIASIRPELDGFITTNAPGIQGQGIQMAQAIGADTVDLEQIQLHPTVHVQGSDAVLITEGLRGDGAILVNQEGERFFDEVSTRDKVSAAEFEQTGGYAWLIVDSRMSDASNVIQGYINKGYAETGETWEELAEAIGAPAETLAATMEKWNACVEAKEDAEFGRVSFANPLDQAPFYAIKVQPGIHHTMGGIRINSEAQVLDADGNVIPGLFAAGEVTGGVHGNNRLGGNAVADFVIFGRIAGASAAAYINGEPVAAAVPAAEAPVEDAAEAPAEPAAEEAEDGGLTDGEYTASAESLLNFENVYVTIVVEGGKIVSVDVDTSSQSADIGAKAEPDYEAQIMAAQGADIDGVSGATVTSLAVQEAYADVLRQAGYTG